MLRVTNKHMKHLMVCIVMLLTIIMPIFIPMTASAETTQTKEVVRVSCGVNNSLYLDDNGDVQGSSADYIKELAKISNWELEYVEGNWTECYRDFLDGNIDILLPTQKDANREELMNFSTLIGGYQVVAMFARDNEGFCYEDFDAFNNARIAVTHDSSNASVLEEYAKNNGFTYTPVNIESATDKITALKNGDVDFIVFSTLNSSDDLSMVATLDAIPFYYAVSKDNSELLKELNQGMKNLLIQQPELVKQVLSETAIANCTVAYTRDEFQCIKDYGKIVVGFYEDTAPLCEVHEDGSYQGIYIELLQRVSEISGIEIELYPIDRSQYGLDLVRDGTIDFIVGSSDAAFESMDMTDFAETTSIMDYNTVAVTKQEYILSDDAETKFALTSARQYWENYLYTKYPNASVTYYESARDCLSAVSNGKADATLLNTMEYNYQSKNSRYSGLIEWESFRMKSSTVMVCSADIDPNLLSVINKTFQHIGSTAIQDTINYYLNTPYHSYTLEDSIYNARIPAIIVIVIIMIAVLVAFLIVHIKKKNYLVLEEKNNELIKANAAKTDFLARMSHDMRTPMNGILGLTALMKEKSDLTEIREDLSQVEYSGKYLLNLINDTLNMNKIESGKMELHTYPINKEELFSSVLVNAQMLAKEKDIELQIITPDIARGKRTSVIADASRVQQILMNLISNAVKYTPQGGKIEIIIETASTTDTTVTDRYIIRDNGIGMSEEFLPHLYDAFSQEGRVGMDRLTGTGLGMAIVKQLVELMDGSIDVKSRINEGTEFTVQLHYPIYHGEIETEEKTAYSEDILKGKRILVCEDHPLNTKITVQLLEKKGILVDTSANGKIGVEKFAASSPGYYDLILMDIRMPEMDGIEATRRIRALAHPDAVKIPIVAMTANAFDEDREQTRQAGMNAHLSKPIVPELLYQTLTEQIAKHNKKS